MASFLAKLSLGGGNEYTVLNCEYELFQPVDQQNCPSSNPKGGLLRVVVESAGFDDLIQWATSPTMSKNGHLHFYKGDSAATLKKIGFFEAYCIRYKEVYDSTGSTAMKISLTLSARVLDFGGNRLVNKWPGIAAPQMDGPPDSSSSASASLSINSYMP